MVNGDFGHLPIIWGMYMQHTGAVEGKFKVCINKSKATSVSIQ